MSGIDLILWNGQLEHGWLSRRHFHRRGYGILLDSRWRAIKEF
jgi:hypothetical protein